MKNKNTFSAALWWVLICLLAGIFVLLSADPQGGESEREQRTLTAAPKLTVSSLLSGDYMDQTEDYLKDGFIARDAVIDISNGIMNVFDTNPKESSATEAELDAEQDMTAASEETADETTAVSAADTSAEEGADADEGATDDTAEEINDGGTEEDMSADEEPITNDTAYFWMNKTDGSRTKVRTYTREKTTVLCQDLQLIRSHLPEDGMVFFTESPLASGGQKLMTRRDEYSGWGSTDDQFINQILSEMGVTNVKAYSTPNILLPYMTGDVPMFYATDHHWTPEAAYIVCAEMLKDRGFTVIDYDEYTYKSLQTDANESGQKDIINVLYPLYPCVSTIVTNRTEVETIKLMSYEKRTYRALMFGTRKPWRRIITGADTGRKCLVICDSFGNAFAPWLLAYYDEVHMCDFRKGDYNKSEVGGNICEQIDYYGIDDVYVITGLANDLTKDSIQVYLTQNLTN